MAALRKKSAVILMYHRISAKAPEPNWLAVAPDNFAQHMAHIREAYRPLHLNDLVDAAASDSIPPRSVAVTFDDGYADNYLTALPLLAAAEVPATVFVTADFVNSTQESWWDALARFILESEDVPPTLALHIENRDLVYETSTAEQRQIVYASLTETLRPLAPNVQHGVLDDLSAWSGLSHELRPDYRTMSTAELTALDQSNWIEIGAHTIGHPILPTLSAESQRREIVESRKQLETLLKHPVCTFAYPNGDFNDESLEIVRNAGFKAACTTANGCIRSNDDPLRLKRYAVNDWDIETFRHNLRLFFDDEHCQ